MTKRSSDAASSDAKKPCVDAEACEFFNTAPLATCLRRLHEPTAAPVLCDVLTSENVRNERKVLILKALSPAICNTLWSLAAGKHDDKLLTTLAECAPVTLDTFFGLLHYIHRCEWEKSAFYVNLFQQLMESEVLNDSATLAQVLCRIVENFHCATLLNMVSTRLNGRLEDVLLLSAPGTDGCSGTRPVDAILNIDSAFVRTPALQWLVERNLPRDFLMRCYDEEDARFVESRAATHTAHLFTLSEKFDLRPSWCTKLLDSIQELRGYRGVLKARLIAIVQMDALQTLLCQHAPPRDAAATAQETK